MRGTVIGYDETGHAGVISGFDGNRYKFTLMEWKGASPPNVNMEVDFEPDEGIAREIFVLAQNTFSQTANKTAGFWSAVWGWGLGVFFLLAALGTIIEQPQDRDILAAILFIIASAFLIPPIFNLISEKSGHAISTGPRVIIVILLVVVGIISVSPTV
ncbi:MAG: hypothetical protein GKS02_01180 [Alphaproteobacteria bacterium]|nr:hypothetical protein [Alphaproteobacteria bacterium]